MIFFTGFLIGVVSLIPGISGGTMLVLTKKYEEITEAITHFKLKKNRRCLLTLILGILLGAITFARIIELLFFLAPNVTMILFSGFVLFSIPDLMEKKKPNFFYFFLGLFLIYFLFTIRIPTPPVIVTYPKITFLFLILFMGCGILDGFFTILPGISGSMIMMILGPYFLYKSYLAHLDFQNIQFLLPLFFYFLGDLFGLFLGSKTSVYFLKHHRKKFMSFLFGMVIMSALILIPYSVINASNVLFYSSFLLISFIFCQILNLIKLLFAH